MVQGLKRTLLLTALVAGGCDTGPKTAGIDGSGGQSPVVIQGPIEGFGSIVVDGSHYEVGNAQINVNGLPGNEMDLALGQLVTIRGTLDRDNSSGVADSVVFEANVRGPVESVDVDQGTLRVMGQAVATDASTILNFGPGPDELDLLSPGDTVEVSGLVGASGLISATRIERHPTNNGLRVIGVVANLDSANLTFQINDLQVDYGTVQVLDGFPTGEPRDGDEVLVEGMTISGAGALIAVEMRLFAGAFGESEGDEAEVEGLITRFVSPTDFDVSNLPITITAATDYEGGDEGDLQLNVKVQVEGTVDSSGTIVAERIEVKDGGRVVGGG